MHDPDATGASDSAQEVVTTTSLGDWVSEHLLESVLFTSLPEGVQSFLRLLADYPVLLLLLITAVGLVLGKLAQWAFTRLAGRLVTRTPTPWDDRMVDALRRPVFTTPLVLSLAFAAALLPMPSGIKKFTIGILGTVLLLSWLRASLKVTHAYLKITVARKRKNALIQARTLPIFEISLKVLLVALAGYVLLGIWGVNPTAWLASAGVIGIAVGFAAKDTLANLFSGIFIAADAPYKIGDYIVLDTGERGEVTALGMRSTRILTRDDIEVTVPNAIIANAKILNESGGTGEAHRIRVPVGVAYGSDVDLVCQVLEAVAREHPDILKDPEPRVRMRAFGPSSLDFELLGWIPASVLRGKVVHDLLLTIYRRFREERITIPFPQTDIHVRSMPRDD